MPKKSSRRKGVSRKSVPKKLILEVVLEHEKLPKKPPFFRASWTAKEAPKRRKK